MSKSDLFDKWITVQIYEAANIPLDTPWADAYPRMCAWLDTQGAVKTLNADGSLTYTWDNRGPESPYPYVDLRQQGE